MTSSPALHDLAERLGLHRHYISATGEGRTVADSSLRALCTALGHPAESEASAEYSLSLLQNTQARLDSVIVAIEGEAVEAVWRGQQAAGETFTWRIDQETGGVLEGSASLAAGVSGANVLRLPLAGLPSGYHRIEIRCADDSETSSLIVAPQCAYTPPAWQREGRKDWSITTQLYSLRSERNWGIGDFSDLAELARHAAALGASSIGLSPLHALFPAIPRHLSPYSPSSRAFLNAVYIDVEVVPELAGDAAARALLASDEFQASLQAARASEFVDYETVWSVKLQMLRLLFAAFQHESGQQPRGDRALAFAAFKEAGALALLSFARFEALQQHFVDNGTGASWHVWPDAMRDVGSPAVAEFAATHADAIEFSLYLQWEADRQLGEVAQKMRDYGMTTGLYRDVAVGVDPNGAEAWSDQTMLVSGASVGAPPDAYNPIGQDWGLTPLNPVALQQCAYAPFIAAVRANMRHAGAIRIDHVIGLKRLFWVPSGMAAAEGAYLSYPYEHLMAIIAIESQRHQCLVVGEDLGTVPEGFREDAARRALLSYRVLMFEREGGDGQFMPPEHYPELAAAAVSTHDLPSLAGLWSGRDLEWRSQLELYPDEHGAAHDLAFRSATRSALLAALVRHGDLAQQVAQELASVEAPSAQAMTKLATAAHCFLAKAPSRLLLVQVEDIAGEVEQMNLPGTVDQHPNWRRKLQRSIDHLFADPALIGMLQAINRSRGAGAV